MKSYYIIKTTKGFLNCNIIDGISFTQERYESAIFNFKDLSNNLYKIHQNLNEVHKCKIINVERVF